MSNFFEATPIENLYIYKPQIYRDARGMFFESYNADHFKKMGLNSDFVQDNRSVSVAGTLRGLHLQTGDSAQAKLVTVLSGHVYDVAVDLRPDSKTFGKTFGLHLKGEEPRSLYIPRGFAHGFVVLSERAEFFYKVDNFYNKAAEDGIIYDDPSLQIDWPIDKNKIILSDKDKLLKTLSEFCKTQKKEGV